MKRTPVGHIRKHFIPCKDCDGLGTKPHKVISDKGTATEWRDCGRCKKTGLMLDWLEELDSKFEADSGK